jgi:hypothetical protein
MDRKNKKSEFYSPFDPNGSYTGVSNSETPIQDADDL